MNNPKLTTANHGELTDTIYWDKVWQRLNRVSVIYANDPRYGCRGDFLRMVARHIPKKAGMSVLELGGAWSYRALALAKWWGAHVTILDQSPVGIETTRAIFEVNGCPASIVLGDLFYQDFQGKTFDLILHFGLLEHFSDPQPVLEVCAQHLTEGGKVLFTMPNMNAWGAALWKRWAPDDWSKHIEHSEATIRVACKAAGLTLLETFHFGAPMLQIALWERKGLLPKAVTLAQGIINLPGKFLPIYDRGQAKVSMYRGFVACKGA